MLAVSTALIGCVSTVRDPTYYLLQVPPAANLPNQGEVGGSVAIRQFRSPVYLRQGAIAYRQSPEQIGFYDYHRWAADPRDFVTNAIADRLRASGQFAVVKLDDGRSDVDYIVNGRLEKLDEIDYEEGVKVEVAISAQMTELRTGTTVWANAASDVGQVDQGSVPAVVAEMSRAMDRTIQKLLSSLPAAIATSLKEKGTGPS